MPIYTKSTPIKGAWLKGADVRNGAQCKLVSEATPIESQYKNKDGSVKVQDVAKVLFNGEKEPKNISLNRATIDALIEAFGSDSAKWVNHQLTALTEKVSVAGKRVTVVYLVPEGYELKEDLAGYLHIQKVGADEEMPIINLDEEPTQDDEMPGGF